MTGLETDRLLLRELCLDDVEAVQAWDADPVVARWLFNEPRTREETLAYLRTGEEATRADPRRVYDWAVVEKATGLVVGRVGFRQGEDPRDASLWYLMRPDRQGRGYAVEAARLAMKFGFRELALHRMWVDVDPENVASIRVAEKLGMRHEALHLENVFVKGAWRGTAILAILAREWNQGR